MQLKNIISLLPLIAVAAAYPQPPPVSNSNTPQCPNYCAGTAYNSSLIKTYVCGDPRLGPLILLGLYSVISLTPTNHMGIFALVSFWPSGTTLPENRTSTRPKTGSNLIQTTRQSKATLPSLSASRLIVLDPSLVRLPALGVSLHAESTPTKQSRHTTVKPVVSLQLPCL